MRNNPYQTIQILPLPTTPGIHRIEVPSGKALQDPKNPNRVLMGPSVWIVTVHPDGKIDMEKETS